MKRGFLFTVIFAFLFIFSTIQYAEKTDIYCHISLVEGDIYILKSDEDNAKKAIINYPLVSGDIIYSNGNAKCEIQFGNGTVIRMGKHTELRLSTLLTPSLTTSKKITTLHLNKGSIYTMNQVYRGEIFQIITPTAVLKMFKRSTNSILVNKKGETHLYVMRGKVSILFENNRQIPQQESIGAKNGCWIKAEHKLIRDNQRQNPEFLIWNEKINKNFKNLHYGISKIPQVIYRRSPGIVHFAERFSTKFGSWEYHELFGYIWKPADFVFHDQRPFWDANYVEINKELFLVPNQPWGWAPAHLGTWFWSETDGWIWIPGDAFSPGICSTGLINWPGEYFNIYSDLLYQTQLFYWIHNIYGSINLYKIYRTSGSRAWRLAYKEKFNKNPLNKKPSLKNIPAYLRTIFEKVNQTPIQKVVRFLEKNHSKTRVKFNVVPVKILQNRVSIKKLPPVLRRKLKSRINLSKNTSRTKLMIKRDWNPDSKWAHKTGIQLFYSMKKNQVNCPKLKLNSRRITNIQKGILRRSVINRNQNKSVNGSLYVTPTSNNQSLRNSTPSFTGMKNSPNGSSMSPNGNQEHSTIKTK